MKRFNLANRLINIKHLFTNISYLIHTIYKLTVFALANLSSYKRTAISYAYESSRLHQKTCILSIHIPGLVKDYIVSRKGTITTWMM